jgi:signal transduction histidine kinase
MILRLLGPQGIAGLAASLCLAALLFVQHGQTRHWRKQSANLEQLYRGERAAHLQTELNHRRAADAALAEDRAAAARVRAEQAQINQRISDDLQTRLAAARAYAEQLRRQAAATPGDSGRGAAAPVPAIPAAPRRADQAAGQGRLPVADGLIATEQAIQLDALIKWIEQQGKVDPNR